MSATRREVLAMAAIGLAPTLARADAEAPLVIAQGGAVADRMTYVRSSFELAVRQGADFLGGSLAFTRDGLLVILPDNDITSTTDVAQRPEFADRKTSKAIGDRQAAGWFAEDFTLAELQSLILAAGRRRDEAGDRAPLSPLTLQELIDIARAASIRTGRVIGVYPQIVHFAYFAGIGMALEARLADVVRANGYNSPAAAMFVRSHEPAALKALASHSRVRRAQSLAIDGSAADGGASAAAEMISPEGLSKIRAYAQAIAPSGILTTGARKGARAPSPAGSATVAAAHEAGLRVHASADPAQGETLSELTALFAAGVDGVITQAPAVAVRARDRAAA